MATHFAAAAAALAWIFVEWARSGHPSVLGGISGAVAGLVAITPASGFVKPMPALLIGAWGFFAAQGARSGDVVLAANSVLHNLMLVGAFFVDGFALAAEQLCGRATGARNGAAFSRAVKLSLTWGFGFGAATTLRNSSGLSFTISKG